MTPTGPFSPPPENLVAAPLWQKLLSALYCGKGMVRNALKPIESRDKPGKHLHIVDGTVVAQGPNYSLAKRMQHWRAQIEFEAGATVSSMVAPSTATISVIHNRSG